MMKSTSLLVVMLVLAMFQFILVESRVDYNCFFGPIHTVQDDSGTVHQFCVTGINPPYLQRGDYVSDAINTDGTCYECVCDEAVGGLACCDYQC